MSKHKQPESIKAEQSVLGCMMLEAEALETGIEKLGKADFSREAHQIIFEAIQRLALKSVDVDEITLTEELKRGGKLDDVGSSAYLMACIDRVPTASNIEHYIAIVKNKTLLRKLVAAGAKLTAIGYDENWDGDPIAEATSVLMDVSDSADIRERSMMDVCLAAGKRLEKIAAGGDPRVIPFRMESLRNLLYGMGPGEFGIVVGPTGGGKTVELLDFTSTAGSMGRPVLLMSLEMDAEDLAIRMMCADTRQDMQNIRQGDVDWKRSNDCLADYAQYNITPIDHRLSLTQLKIAADRWARKNRRVIAEVGGLIIVDYFGIVRFDRKADNKVDAQEQMAADFKDMARTLGVSVWTGLQLRKAQGNENQATDKAKGGGGITHEADKVIMIEPQAEPDEDYMQPLILNVAKHRGGPTGKINAMFNRKYLRIEEVTERFETPAVPVMSAPRRAGWEEEQD